MRLTSPTSMQDPYPSRLRQLQSVPCLFNSNTSTSKTPRSLRLPRAGNAEHSEILRDKHGRRPHEEANSSQVCKREGSESHGRSSRSNGDCCDGFHTRGTRVRSPCARCTAVEAQVALDPLAQYGMEAMPRGAAPLHERTLRWTTKAASVPSGLNSSKKCPGDLEQPAKSTAETMANDGTPLLTPPLEWKGDFHEDANRGRASGERMKQEATTQGDAMACLEPRLSMVMAMRPPLNRKKDNACVPGKLGN